jgi:hypothetical protein
MTDITYPTEAEIMSKQTPAGGWTRAQLAEWGVGWPPPRGWKARLIEREKIMRHADEVGQRHAERLKAKMDAGRRVGAKEGARHE